MRIKTYLATYILFLAILFSCFGIISVYMTNSQINMYMEKGEREFNTIAQTLFRDLSVLTDKDEFLADEVRMVVDGYTAYYRRNNIIIEVTDLSSTAPENDNLTDTEISFIRQDGEQHIHIARVLPEPFEFYRIDYYYNMTEHITDMRHIQNILLVLCVLFSIVTAVILYFVLSSIFRPLNIISKTTKKIADGHYGERIAVKGKNDLSTMAENFNRMAEEIEKQIHMLADEAAAKQRFIDNFAHEIRTPLTSIYGNAEYMQKASLEEGEIIEYTQSIMDKSNHIKQIANSLLQLATLRNYIPVKTKIPIQRFFDDIRNTIKKSMGDKDIQIVCKSDADTIDGQEDLLKSLFQNLCLNALKACLPKDGAIYLEAKKHNDSIEMSVTDNGCGIPEESLSKVTEPFYRVDKARNRDKGGAGLGLALCKQIAEVHGAVMSVESLEGKGTIVKITFTTS